MLKKLFLSMMAIAVLGFGFVACSDDDDEEETTKQTLPSSLVGKAFFDSTNGVGFAVLDETQYAFIHSNAQYTGVTQKYYIAEKTTDTEYSLTAYKDDTFAEEAGTVYTVKVTDSGISLSFTNAQHASQAGTEYAMTHVFSSLFNTTYSVAVNPNYTMTFVIYDTNSLKYGTSDTRYYKITNVTADSETKKLAYEMTWYTDEAKTTAHGTVTTLTIKDDSTISVLFEGGHGSGQTMEMTKQSE